ncbi:MAG: GAF domain-containing protein [Ignavibacteriaceae bacterium]|nr:GAF domain-containing protein [Ignavibacteriaceae bacterium]
MEKVKTLIIFSENRDTQSNYMAFANLHNLRFYFKDRSKTSIQMLLEQKFDLIIIEIMHPVMSEIEFVDQVHGVAKDVPIIVVSSFFYDTKDLVFGGKIADFILKPLSVEKLVESYEQIQTPQAEVEIPKSPFKETKIDDVLLESKKLSVLMEMSRSLNSITDFDLLLHHIIELAIGALDAERATLFILDKKRKELWSRTGIGIEKQEIRFPMDRGIAGEVVVSGQPQIIDDPYSHPKFNKDVDIKTGFKTRNILCLPMKNLGGEIIGAFQILNKKSGNFNKEDQLFLSSMAANTGIAIENALLNDELKRQLDEIKRSYDDLYIAQNQILKEARFASISEIAGHFDEISKKGTEFSDSIQEIKRQYNFDPNLKKLVEKAGEFSDLMIDGFKSFLEKKRNSIFN